MRLTRFIIQWVVNAFAFYIAITLLSGQGIEHQGRTWVDFFVLAFIFGVVNAILRPILTVLGCPVIILTLGLGVLLINTLLFYLTGLVGTYFGVGFTVDGFVPAFLGALIVSIISMFFNWLLRNQKEE